jgi:hypothetical protein
VVDVELLAASIVQTLGVSGSTEVIDILTGGTADRDALFDRLRAPKAPKQLAEMLLEIESDPDTTDRKALLAALRRILRNQPRQP